MRQGKNTRSAISILSETIRSPHDFAHEYAELLPITQIIQECPPYSQSMPTRPRPKKNNLYEYPAFLNELNTHIVGVSADMWFGESFWQYASCTKEELMSLPELVCTQHASHLHVKAWPEPFSEATGEQLIIQRKLLKVLFNIDEHNPYGKVATPTKGGHTLRNSVLIDEKGNVADERTSIE